MADELAKLADKPQSKSRNDLIVGIVIGAGLGMVVGRVLFGERGAGFVFGRQREAYHGIGWLEERRHG